ncbi:cytochrome P450 2D6-like [Xenia sp. Carnegie-2017]|uniref:cytochrome P450 2D6-like n=1 Tax=Xenia sp. Carnegie-2017 TaxID=2897299 RepID=UPI001F04C638|nr:cytochrome P450 2D6-like [Xenia sp. Carnegie-2017]
MFLEIISASFLVWIVSFLVKTYFKRRSMPPGPFPYPIIGNIFLVDVTSKKPFKRIQEKYGDIYTVRLLSDVVVVNTATLAREARLLHKNDVVDKSTKAPLHPIIGPNDIVFAEYGTPFVFRKRVFKSAMHVFGEGIHEAEERGNHAVKCTLDEIKSFEGRSFSPKKLIASAIILQLWQWLTSKELSLDDDIIVKLLEFSELSVKKIQENSIVSMMIPFSSFLPTEFNRNKKRALHIKSSIFSPVVESHLATYTPGKIRNMTHSFIQAYAKEMAKESSKDIGSINDIKDLMVDVVFAGADTTSSTLSWFLLYMTLYPDVQKKIHAELDQVIGKEYLPQMKDIQNLNYLQATMCEVIRKANPIPIAGATTLRDIHLAGFHIPKGTAILTNLAEVHHDEREWPEESKFKPERFLDNDGKFVGWTHYLAFMPFGLGRRQCGGISFAKIMLFTFSSTLLYYHEFRLPEGVERPMEEGSRLQLVSSPNHFEVVAFPRT